MGDIVAFRICEASLVDGHLEVEGEATIQEPDGSTHSEHRTIRQAVAPEVYERVRQGLGHASAGTRYTFNLPQDGNHDAE